MSRVKFIRDKEQTILALDTNKTAQDGVIYVATDTGSMWLGTGTSSLLQLANNTIDTNTTYTLTKKNNQIILTGSDGSSCTIYDSNTTYSNVSSSGTTSGLMTPADKAKLDSIEEGANHIVVDDAISSTSANPVQNQVISSALAGKVPTSREVNGKSLSTDVSLNYSDVGAAAESHTHTKSQITDFPTSLKNPNSLTIKSGGTTLESYDGSASKTLDIVGGNNITVTPDTTNGKLTISAASIGSATGDSSGLMTAEDKAKLNGIASGAEVNQNAFSNVVVGSTTVAADSKTDTLTLAAGSNVTLTPDATNDKIIIAATDTKYSTGTTSTSGLTKLYTSTGTATDGTMTRSAITSALGGKANSSHTHYSLTTEGDNRSTNTKPSNYPTQIKFTGLKYNDKIDSPSNDTYSYVIGMRGWNDNSGGNAYEFATNNTGVYFRTEKDKETWNDWNRFYTTKNKPTWSDVQSKPTFATVATSGSYNDLSNKPTIPTVPSSIKNPNALTISLNGTPQGAYDGSSAKSINITPASIGALTSGGKAASATVADSANAVAWGNVSGKPTTFTPSSHNHSAENITSGTLSLDRIPNVNDKVTAVAASKITGTIDASHLPSYVDDVVEGYYSSSKFYTTKGSDGTYSNEIAGEAGKIYTDLNTNKIYRWSGSTFVVISDTITLGETSATAYRGDRGAAAYTHISKTDNPHGVTKAQVGLGNVENKSSATIRGELTKSNVTTALGYTPPTTNTTYGDATQSTHGLMSTADKTKLDGIATGANNYSLPTASSTLGGVKTTSTVTSTSGYTATPIIDGVPYYKDTNTTYSAATASAAGLMSANDKSKLDGIASNANNYSHPTSSGNKHIPAGGSSGQILRWSADGTAVWGSDYNTWTALKGATADADGGAGYAPQPKKGQNTSFLRGDGTWVVPTNTTYSNMTGATSSAAGARGLVPAPAAGNNTLFLRGDGTWATPTDTNTTYSAGSGISLSGTTINNSGVRSISTGSSNGTISVNTNGSSANVSVKGLAGAAYKGVDTSLTLSSTSTNVPTSAAVASLVSANAAPEIAVQSTQPTSESVKLWIKI